MYNKHLKIVFFFIFLTHFSNAQIVFKSLGDIWKYADENNISIKNAVYDLRKSFASQKQSISNFLPQVVANGTYTYNTALQTTLIPAAIFNGPEGQYKAVQFGQKYIYNGGITAQMDIVNIQTWFNAELAKQNKELSKDSLANMRKSIFQQTATQYYNYLLMQIAAELAEKSVAISDSVFTSISYKYKEGLVNVANVDMAKMNLMRAKQTSITSQYQMITAKNNLKSLLNIALGDSMTIKDGIETNFELLPEAAFAEDPTVTIAKQQTIISHCQYKITNSSYLPTLSILYSNSTQQNDNIYEPFKSDGPKWFPATYWTLKASWNIFSGGSKWFQTEKSKIAEEQKKELFENTQKQVAINDENLKIAYKKAVALMNNTKEVMDLSFDNYNHISNRYFSGIATLEDRLNSFSDYINYQNQYLNSLSDMLVQLYMIKIRQQSFR